MRGGRERGGIMRGTREGGMGCYWVVTCRTKGWFP